MLAFFLFFTYSYFINPILLATSLKHCLQSIKLYERISPLYEPHLLHHLPPLPCASLFLPVASYSLGFGIFYSTSTPYSCLKNSTASSLFILCVLPILALFLLFFAILYPGLFSTMLTSIPKMPISGLYFVPGMSMCSCMPTEILP